MDVPIKSVNFLKYLILNSAKGYHSRISRFVVKMIDKMAANHGKQSTQRKVRPIRVLVMVGGVCSVLVENKTGRVRIIFLFWPNLEFYNDSPEGHRAPINLFRLPSNDNTKVA